MKITRTRLRKMINEELAQIKEGLHDEGLRESITDFVSEYLSGWHDEAKASLHKHVAENGFDISDIIMQSLGGGEPQ